MAEAKAPTPPTASAARMRFLITNVILPVNTNVMQVRDQITLVNTIAERVAQARIAAKLTQDQLAKAANVSQSTIGNIEAGLRKRPRELLAIAAALQVEASWLQSGKASHLIRASAAQPTSAALPRALQLLLDTLTTMPPARWASVRAQLDQWVNKPHLRVQTQDELLSLLQAPPGKQQDAA